jgi:tetratricopeptide (TPR) repeat protein
MRRAALVLAAMLAAGAEPAAAQGADRDWAECSGGGEDARVIRGCTAVIGRGTRESAQGRANALANRGDARFRGGDLAAALEDYDAAVRLAPQDATLLTSRANLHIARGDVAAARADFDRAVAADPRNAMAYNDRGFLRFEQGDLRGALADFETAAALGPDEVLFLSNRGQARLLAGQAGPALADFDEIIRRAPDSSWGHLGRAETLLATGQGKAAAAPAEAARERAAASGRAFDSVLQARALWVLGRSREAVALLDRYLVEHPGPQPTAVAYRGEAWLALGDAAAAAGDFEAVLEWTPGNLRALAGLAMAREARGDLPGAAEAWRRAAAGGMGGAADQAARVEATIPRR